MSQLLVQYVLKPNNSWRTSVLNCVGQLILLGMRSQQIIPKEIGFFASSSEAGVVVSGMVRRLFYQIVRADIRL